LVVEIDGEHHAYQKEADARRTAAMKREGWRVIRFWANEVRENREGIWAAIRIVIEQMPDAPPHLTSPPRGRGK
jgi:very-short-patch-repair endonuclease